MCLKIHHQEWVNIANTLFKFLYQVFPGTSAQCKRQLLRAARIGELDTVQKLVGDTKTAQVLCNSARMDAPCTAHILLVLHVYKTSTVTWLPYIDSNHGDFYMFWYACTHGIHICLCYCGNVCTRLSCNIYGDLHYHTHTSVL